MAQSFTSTESQLSDLDFLDLSQLSDNDTADQRSDTAENSTTSNANSVETETTKSIATQEPPEEGSGYGGQVFEIEWDKILLSTGEIAVRVGEIGYRVANRRQIGGRGAQQMVWRFGADILHTRDNGIPTRYWLCRTCHLSKRYKSSFLTASGFKSIINHLRREHRIGANGEKITAAAGPLRKHLTNNTRALQDFDPDKQKLFATAFPDWVIKQNPSFCTATNKETIAMFQLLRSGTSSLFYQSPTSLSRLIKLSYQRRCGEIKALLLGAKSRIHLSSDLWSSPNNKSLLGVVSHFLEESFTHRTILIGMPRIWGGHDGNNLAETLFEISRKFEIKERLGCFIMDNATNNDTMVKALSKEIKSVQPNQRLRCVGHIINLVVKAILFGEGITEFTEGIIGCSDGEAFSLWRKFGAVGKVNNTVKYIMRSDQRRQFFLDLQKRGSDGVRDSDSLFDHTKKLLIKDGGVQWNSTYYMLRRAIELREFIERFQRSPHVANARDDSYSPALDKVSRVDWGVIIKYMKILRYFVEATAKLKGNAEGEGNEGNQGSIWEMLPTMQAMYDRIATAIDKVGGR